MENGLKFYASFCIIPCAQNKFEIMIFFGTKTRRAFFCVNRNFFLMLALFPNSLHESTISCVQFFARSSGGNGVKNERHEFKLNAQLDQSLL
jgi:hypothetical protein